MLKLKVICFLLIAMLAVGGVVNSTTAEQGVPRVVLLNIEGTIGPAVGDYIERALHKANEQDIELIVLRIDTPGGLDLAMRSIIKQITTSKIPVASYVSPGGARAASAGTYILYASHIAAMAPGTNLGAATPVQVGGIPTPTGIGKKDKEKESASNDPAKQKVINDAAAYIRGLAQMHGRNQQWAEKAVREAASLSAEEALKENVIDLIAADFNDLLIQLNGYEIEVLGTRKVLVTEGAVTEIVEPDWRSDLLSVITNPNIAYILMLIGFYGLILEFYNPGAIVPGTIGAISLILALYAFQMLPINYAGMGLILLGVALMIGEVFEPSFGMLGIGGIIAFVFGSIILIDTEAPGYGIHLSVIISFAVVSALITIFVIGLALKARRRPVVSGREELLGKQALVLEDFDREGVVSLHGEHWPALSETALQKDQPVKVVDVKGITLTVSPFGDASTAEEEGEAR